MKGNKIPQRDEIPVRGKLLTAKEVAVIIRMSDKWIYAQMKKGTLPFPWFFLSTGKRVIDSADLDDWLRLSKVPAGSLPGNTQEAP